MVNIALEGIILFGAFAAAVTTQFVEAPYLVDDPRASVPFAPWIGLLAAAIVGGLVGWLHAVISIRYKADQIISGTAINLMAIGLPAVLLVAFYNNSATSEPVRNRLPEYGSGAFSFSPLVYLAFLLVPVVYYVVFRTPFGLRLRSVGEHPEAADSVGINVKRMRYYGVILSGVLAGLGGRIPLDWQPQPVHLGDVGRTRLYRAGGAHLRQMAPLGRPRRDAAVWRVRGGGDAFGRRATDAPYRRTEHPLYPDDARAGGLYRAGGAA